MNEQTPQSIQPVQKLEPHIAAVIAYIPLFGSLFVYLTEKENKFVQYHGLHSLYFWLVVIGVNGIITSLKAILVGFILDPFFQLASVALWFFLMYKAYNKEEFELPIIGELAKKHIYKR